MADRYIRYGAEAAWGTAAATQDQFWQALSEEHQDEPEFERIETVRDSFARDLALLSLASRGPIEVAAGYEEAHWVWDLLLGSTETVDGGVGGNDPVTKVHTSPDPGDTGSLAASRAFTMAIARDDDQYDYPGCKTNSVQFVVSTTESGRQNVEIIGKGAGAVATTPTTGINFRAFVPIRPPDVCISFGGDTQLVVQSLDLTITREHDEPFGLCSSSLAGEPQQNATIEIAGTCEVLWKDLAQYNIFAAQGKTAITITCTGPDIPGSADPDAAGAAIPYDHVISLPVCTYTQTTPHLSGRERLTATYEFQGSLNTDDQDTIVVKTSNLVTAMPTAD